MHDYGVTFNERPWFENELESYLDLIRTAAPHCEGKVDFAGIRTTIADILVPHVTAVQRLTAFFVSRAISDDVLKRIAYKLYIGPTLEDFTAFMDKLESNTKRESENLPLGAVTGFCDWPSWAKTAIRALHLANDAISDREDMEPHLEKAKLAPQFKRKLKAICIDNKKLQQTINNINAFASTCATSEQPRSAYVAIKPFNDQALELVCRILEKATFSESDFNLGLPLVYVSYLTPKKDFKFLKDLMEQYPTIGQQVHREFLYITYGYLRKSIIDDIFAVLKNDYTVRIAKSGPLEPLEKTKKAITDRVKKYVIDEDGEILLAALLEDIESIYKTQVHIRKEHRLKQTSKGRNLSALDRVNEEIALGLAKDRRKNAKRNVTVLRFADLQNHSATEKNPGIHKVRAHHHIIEAYQTLLVPGNIARHRVEIIETIQAIRKTLSSEESSKLSEIYKAYGQIVNVAPATLLQREIMLFINAGEIDDAEAMLEVLEAFETSSAVSVHFLAQLIKSCKGEIPQTASAADAVKPKPDAVPSPSKSLNQKQNRRQKRALQRQAAAAALSPVAEEQGSKAAAETDYPKATEEDQRQEARELRLAAQAALAQADSRNKKKADKPRPIGAAAIRYSITTPILETNPWRLHLNQILAVSTIGSSPIFALIADYTPVTLNLIVPLRGVAQTVNNSIEDGTWDFTRKQFEDFLTSLNFKVSSGKGVHTKGAASRNWLEVLHKNESIACLFADVDLTVGSLTLPRWKQNFVPFYMRRQIKTAHAKICSVKLLEGKAGNEAETD